MTLHGFQDRATAERLRDLAKQPATGSTSPRPDNGAGESWIFRTPAGGIDAFDDTGAPYNVQEIPSAECEAWILYQDSDGKIKRKQAKNEKGENLKVLVANMLPSEIEPNTWFGAHRVAGGAFLVSWGSC